MKLIQIPILLLLFCFSKVNAQEWIQNFKITEPTRVADNSFGSAISTFDGIVAYGVDQAHIGALNNAGKVYLAKADCEGWPVYQELTAPNPTDYGGFGIRVLLKDKWLLISGVGLIQGNHSVYVYKKGDDDTFTFRQRIDHPEGTVNESFGFKFDLVENVMVITAINRSIVGSGHYLYPLTQGSAYAYVNDGTGNWSYVQKIEASDREPQDHFGISISMDEETMVIGAPREGPKRSGAAYIFVRNVATNTWTEIKKIVSDDYRGFQTKYGHNVKIENGIIAVSSGQDPNYNYDSHVPGVTNSNGAVYLYRSYSNQNWVHYQKLTITDATATELRFGEGLELYEDQLAVGGQEWVYDTSGSLTAINAKVYMFSKDGNDNWIPNQILNPNQNSSTYGSLISIYEQDMFVNARWDSYDANDENYISSSGSVYLYNTYEFEPKEKPVLKPTPTIRACADLGNGFSTGFDLSAIEEELVEDPNGFIFYYSDEQGNELPSSLPANYANTTAYIETILVRIENKNNAHCFEESQITLETISAFELNEIPDLFECAIDGSSHGLFDISSLSTSLVTDPDDYDFIYYNEMGNDISDAIASPYQNMLENGEELTIIVTDKNTLCTQEQTVLLNVVNTFAHKVPVLYSCTTAANGMVAFDTSGISNQLVRGQTNKTIQFFDENNVLLNSPLPNPYYLNPDTVQTITAVVQDVAHGCLAETVITFSSTDCPDDSEPEDDSPAEEEDSLSLIYIPPFFTPNGDGINEIWNVTSNSEVVENYVIYIFDRYGKLLKTMGITDSWDGRYKGQDMPSSDYWYKITLNNSILATGHFSLKR